MAGLSLMRQEEALIDETQCKGSVLMATGEVLLFTDFLIAIAFLYSGIQQGSELWTWWIVGTGIPGIVAMAVGAHLRGKLTD
jgi:hypothetical protein